METVDLAESIAGGLLLFVLPGLATARALFPEWRFRGPDGLRRALETVTLAFVLSVALTVLVGSLLLGVAPGGFAASWSDPILEAALAAVTVVAVLAGALRGAYSRSPPARSLPAPEPGGAGAWELGRELDRLHREDRRLVHRLRGLTAEDPQVADIERQRAELARRIEGLERRREEEYAQ